MTDDPGDAGLEWPAEEFRFATTTSAGWGGEVGQGDRDQERGVSDGLLFECRVGKVWSWVAGINGVWRDPGQVGMG